MLPKLYEAGVIASPGCAPLAVTGIASGEFPALLTIEIDPVMLPAVVGAKVAVSVTLSEGLKVAGAVIPLRFSPLPVADTLVTFTAAVPVFVTTTCLVLEVPVAMVPKLRLAGFALSWPVAVEVPLPFSGTVMLGFTGSLLVIPRLPVALPEAAGVNVTAIWADCPAEIVFGVVIPPIVKSAPVTVSSETIRSVVPVLFSTRLLVLFDPTETLPKLIEDWLSDNCDGALTAVAERFTTTGVLPPSPCAVKVPVKLPAAVGFTATVKLPVWPTASDIGVVIPVMVKCVLESETCVMLIPTFPVFDAVTVCVDCLPTAT